MFENIGHGLEQLGSSSGSGRNWGAATDADIRGVAVEADQCNRGAAAEADAIGEQQLSQRAVRWRIAHVGKRGEVAEQAKLLVCNIDGC